MANAHGIAPERPNLLLRLLTWFSPSFPIGGFSWSHGLEYAVETVLVRDAAGLHAWVAGLLEHGSLRNDAVLFVEAWRAVRSDDVARLESVAALSAAQRATNETCAESTAQGQSFLKALHEVWGDPWAERLLRLWREQGVVPSATVAMAASCAWAVTTAGPVQADSESGLDQSLTTFLHGQATGLVWAGVKLVPLGQTDGLRVIAGLEDTLVSTTRWAQDSTLDDTGTASPMVDWCSMRHETQYSRLFRS